MTLQDDRVELPPIDKVEVLQETRTPKVRRALLGATLVVSPALMFLAAVLAPRLDWEDKEDLLRTVLDGTTRWQVVSMLGFLGFMLLVPAIIAASELIRRRRPALALTSVILVAASAIPIAGIWLMELTYAAARASDISRHAAFLDRTEDLGATLILLPIFFAGPVGLLVLAFALWRTRATPIWVPAILAVSMVLTFADPGPVASIGWGALALAFFGMAWKYFTAGAPPADA